MGQQRITSVVISMMLLICWTTLFATAVQATVDWKDILSSYKLHDKTKSIIKSEPGLFYEDGEHPSSSSKKPHIVIMKQNPTVSFALEMTPESGIKTKFDFEDQDLKNYAESLRTQQRLAAKNAGIPQKDVTYEYFYAGNGFSAPMTNRQAEKLRGMEGVAAVIEDKLRQKTTDSTIDFIGIGGIDKNDEPCRRIPYDGEGVIVGVIDTGIWPEHPSFADDDTIPSKPFLPPWDKDGKPLKVCDFGNDAHNPNDAKFTCNNKLIGARTFLATYQANTGLDDDEFASCRDDDGHGTHTASTAAGNANVEAKIDGYPKTTVSGVAPKAHIIAYKALGKLGGYTSDLAAAIDQTVRDGVDVINYSIGGGPGPLSVDEIMFLNAANAGIFVAISAGNSGPFQNTIGSPGIIPWATTVGASTEGQNFEAVVTLEGSDGTEFVGASAYDHPSSNNVDERKRTLRARRIVKGASQDEPSAARGLKGKGKKDPEACRAADSNKKEAEVVETFITAPLVDAEYAGGDLCVDGTLNGTIVKGSIVLCRRGDVDRVEKSREVERAGGVGMILYNNDDFSSLVPDQHSVQSVHVGYTQGMEIKSYIAANSNPSASLSTDFLGMDPDAPLMAGFSSRGPNYYENIIKPDVTAPGVSILAGNTPLPCCGSPQNTLFQSISGTSMSSPHVAGAFALIKQAHPDWSSAAAKSAIMTSAYQNVLLGDRTTPAGPFDMGSGHLNKNNEWLRPGLVYQAGLGDYLGFLCGTNPSFLEDDCEYWLPNEYNVRVEPWNLNYPSMLASGFTASRTLKRTIQSVDETDEELHYTASVETPSGYSIEVVPSELSLKGGESATFYLNISSVSPNFDDFSYGSIAWLNDDASYNIYSPIVAKAEAIVLPSSFSFANQMDGSVTYDAEFGYNGIFSVISHGLEPATVFQGTVATDGFVEHRIDLEGQNLHLRIAIPPESTDLEADLDIFVFGPDGRYVDGSFQWYTNELVSIENPGEGTWTILVDGWLTPNDADVDYDMYVWTIPSGSSGSLSVGASPSSAMIGTTGSVRLEWVGLALGGWYWGYASYDTGILSNQLRTVIEVDNR